MNSIDDETAGVAEHHPEKNVTCDKCHIKDSISVDHYGIVTNEANPAKSCDKVGCHDLKTAGKMPFYVKPFASLDESSKPSTIKQRLAAAKNLLQYAKAFKENLPSRTTGLPAFNRLTIDIKAEDKKINNFTKDVPLIFFEPKNAFDVKKDADLLPSYASIGLTNDLFSAFGQDMSVATRLDGSVEARIVRAEDLEKHLPILDDHASILGLLTNSQLVLRYLAALPNDAIDLVTTELAANFPSAAAKTDTATGDAVTGIRRAKTWEIPAAANDGKNKATISLQINAEGTRTQPSTQLQFQLLNSASRSTAILILKKFQEHYANFNSDQARYTLTYQASSEADKNLLTAALQNAKAAASKGDVRRTLTHSENTTTGTISSAGLVNSGISSIKAVALANPAAIRRLRSNIRYKPDLSTISRISNDVLMGPLPRVSVSTQQQQISEADKDKIVFTVSRETASAKPLTVYYSLTGTATAGKDYAKPKLNATIPKNAASVLIPIKLINDKAVEPEEPVMLTITPRNTNGYTLLNANTSTVVIVDDDAPKR
jgi:hypothetical protein